jgi:apolipoprotein N-acyltransferase
MMQLYFYSALIIFMNGACIIGLDDRFQKRDVLGLFFLALVWPLLFVALVCLGITIFLTWLLKGLDEWAARRKITGKIDAEFEPDDE